MADLTAGSFCPPTAILLGKGGIRVYGNEIGTVVIDGGAGELVLCAEGGAGIQAAVDRAGDLAELDGRKHYVDLEGCEYLLTEKLRMRSLVGLRGTGEQATVLTWAGPLGNPLDLTNSMIDVHGELDEARLNTTLTNTASGVDYYPRYSQAFSVASVGTQAVGQWLRVGGDNDPAFGELYGPAGSGPWVDLLRVSHIQALTFNFDSHTLLHHTLTNGGSGEPVTVKGCDPCHDVSFENLTLDGAGIATGVHCDLAVEVTRRRVRFRNFKAEGIVWQNGSLGLYELDCYSDGNNNGWIYLDSGHRVVCVNPRTNPNGPRFFDDPASLIRYAFTFVNQAAECSFFGGEIENMCAGFDQGSARNLLVHGTKLRDLDIDPLLASEALHPSPFVHGNTCGIAFHQGTVDLSIADWSVGTVLWGILAEDCRCSAVDASAFWLHDTQLMTGSDLTVSNTGHSPSQVIDGVSKFQNGFRCQDISADLANLRVAGGVDRAFRHNSSQGLIVRGLYHMPRPSTGSVPQISLQFFTDGAFGRPVFDDVSIYGGIFFDAGYVPDYQIQLSRLWLDGLPYCGSLQLCLNVTGTTRNAGDVVALDPAIVDGSVRTTNAAPAANTHAGAICAIPAISPAANNTLMFVQVANTGVCHVRCDAAQVTPGTLLVAKGAGTFDAIAGAAPADAKLGTALMFKAAGAASNVRAG